MISVAGSRVDIVRFLYMILSVILLLVIKSYVYCNYTGSTIVLIHILDINDNIPEITNKPFTGVIMECDQPKTRILQIHAKDSDLGANSELTYTILNSSARNAFKINADTGLLCNSINKLVGFKTYGK